MTAPERIWVSDGWTRRWHHEPFLGDPGEQYVRFYLYANLAAEKERLESERDDFRRRWEEACVRSGKHDFRAEALAARVRSLEEALRPFAELSDRYPNEAVMVWAYLPELKDLRRARAALSTREEGSV